MRTSVSPRRRLRHKNNRHQTYREYGSPVPSTPLHSNSWIRTNQPTNQPTGICFNLTHHNQPFGNGETSTTTMRQLETSGGGCLQRRHCQYGTASVQTRMGDYWVARLRAAVLQEKGTLRRVPAIKDAWRKAERQAFICEGRQHAHGSMLYDDSRTEWRQAYGMLYPTYRETIGSAVQTRMVVPHVWVCHVVW